MKIKDIQFDKDKLFFTSDTHFFHTNIIKYCDRPFADVRIMNDTLVKEWNRVIPKDGVVFHLGDFSLMANNRDLDSLLQSLNGTIYLVIGNHEGDILSNQHMKRRFKGFYDIAEIFVKDEEITYGEQHLVMCHYPFYPGSWNGGHRGSWNLYGHVHGGLSNKGVIKTNPAQLDVGVDCHQFAPISYQQVKEMITKQMLKKQ
jgi:calcineurin-like phosphoesterase family protein